MDSNKRQIECSSEFVENTTVNDIVSFVGNIGDTLDTSLRYIVTEVDTSNNKLVINIDGLKDPLLGNFLKIINISLQFIAIIEVDQLQKKWNYLQR